MQTVTEQGKRYRDVIASFLDYADRRLDVTQALPPSEAKQLAGDRLVLVGRELWRNLTLAADFVRDNPDGLSAACLDTVGRWGHGIALRCIPIACDEQHNVTVETEAGTFLLNGAICGLQDAMFDGSIAFKTALLPFDDLIVCGTPVDVGERPGAGELAWMRRQAVARGLTGVARTADELLSRAEAYARSLTAGEGTGCGDVQAGIPGTGSPVPPGLPEGFHRSAAMGVSLDERLGALRSSCDDPLSSPCAALAGKDGDGEGEVVRVAAACALLYGVVSLSEAFEQYVALSDAPQERCRFRDLVASRALQPSCTYGLWEQGGVTYLVAASLLDGEAYERALASVVREGRGRQERVMERMGWITWETAVIDEACADELELRAQRERCHLQDLRRGLLRRQEVERMRPLERRMVVQGMTRYLLQLEATRSLCDYLDAHVPDGEEDRSFAPSLTLAIVYLLLSCDATVNDAYDLLVACGMMRCEGGEWSHTLGRMVVNVYNSLPRWERFGWSLRQIRERLTGRRTFYAQDGSVVRVGGNDPCPCGRGRAYRLCCGR